MACGSVFKMDSDRLETILKPSTGSPTCPTRRCTRSRHRVLPARSLGDKLLLAESLCLQARSSAENASVPGQEALQIYQSLNLKDKAQGRWVFGRLGLGGEKSSGVGQVLGKQLCFGTRFWVIFVDAA